jgi:hypothetical protein
MRSAVVLIALLSLAATGCSRSQKPSNILYSAGDKAIVGPLVYSVTDTEVTQQLGDEPNPRNAQERFYLIKVSVTNSSSDDQSIPTMTLVDDAGHNYTELPDGAGVANWLGVVRKVRAAQTEQGVVVFDAPTKHYRLRINDALDEKEIAVDVPLNFVHERMKALDTNPAGSQPPGVVVPEKK